MFNDPWNPEQDEIIEWMNSDDNWPDQDFDLSLATSGNDELLIELAKNASLKKHYFLIHVLYFMVGDSIYHDNHIRQEYLKELLGKIKYTLPEIEKWKQESFSLLNKEIEFEYNYWCNYMFKNTDKKES